MSPNEEYDSMLTKKWTLRRRDEQSSPSPFHSEMQPSVPAADRDIERMYGMYSADPHIVRREVF